MNCDGLALSRGGTLRLIGAPMERTLYLISELAADLVKANVDVIYAAGDLAFGQRRARQERFQFLELPKI